MAPNIGFAEAKGNDISMMIFPNPNKGVFNIEINTKNTKQNKFILKIYSTTGVLIKQENIEVSGRKTIPVNMVGISKGIYFVNLFGENDVITMKFIVN
jgi:hypothetical protein